MFYLLCTFIVFSLSCFVLVLLFLSFVLTVWNNNKPAGISDKNINQYNIKEIPQFSMSVTLAEMEVKHVNLGCGLLLSSCHRHCLTSVHLLVFVQAAGIISHCGYPTGAVVGG